LKLTELLAIYASCLSTIVFAWNISRAIPKFRVDIMFGTHSSDDDIDQGVYIGVRNPSADTVHLSGIYILYRYRDTRLIELISHFFKYRRWPRTVGWVHTSLSCFGLKDEWPLALEAGRSHKVFVSNEVLEKILADSVDRYIKAKVQDQLWRNKYSRKFFYPKNGVLKKRIRT
jgi:hypothetical protein